MSRRRQPPLFEFLGSPRSSVLADGNAMGRRPVVVVAAPSTARPDPARAAPSPGMGAAAGSTARKPAVKVPVPVLALIAASVLGVGFMMWSLAFKMGQSESETKLAPHLAGNTSLPGSSLAAAPPLAASSNSGLDAAAPASMRREGVQPPSGATPTSPAGVDGRTQVPASPASVAREPGFNYLELCVLTYRDAAAAAEYLAKNGVPAGIAPARREVDPASAQAKNQPHLLFVADGIASDRFKASEHERKALESRVEQIGKRFLREERGASDFSRPQWRLFKQE